MSDSKKFYQMTIKERRQVLREETGISKEEMCRLSGECGLSEETADRMIENVIGR